MKSSGQSVDCHSRPRSFDRDTTRIDDLMTATRRNKDHVAQFLFGDVDFERCSRQLFHRDIIRLVVKFLLELVHILCSGCRVSACCHKPKRGSSIFCVAHDILTRRSTSVLMARRESVADTEVTHECLYTFLLEHENIKASDSAPGVLVWGRSVACR
jgi:hypothetical protein